MILVFTAQIALWIVVILKKIGNTWGRTSLGVSSVFDMLGMR